MVDSDLKSPVGSVEDEDGVRLRWKEPRLIACRIGIECQGLVHQVYGYALKPMENGKASQSCDDVKTVLV